MHLDIAFSPLLPWILLGPLFGIAALAVLAALLRRARGALWRGFAAMVLALLLLNPSLREEEREPVRDVAVVVVDRSDSQKIDGRLERTEAAAAALTDALSKDPTLELRVETVDGPTDRTALFEALARATADVPRRRLAGAILVTDGEVHDVPGDPATLGDIGPVHALLTGRPDERDRRLVLVSAPAYGLVGNDATITLRLEDLPGPLDPAAEAGAVPVELRRDGTTLETVLLTPGVDTPVTVRLDHAGPTVFEAVAPVAEGEISGTNNAVAGIVNGVRDRLRVLLVTGEPHPGARTWRDILKADPSVDLVHFTILRPPEKQDATPIEELSLIAFPIRELFEEKLTDFDLVIFDRYRAMGVLPNLYLDNIARWVEGGGAFLEVSGSAFADPMSLYWSPMGRVLPGEPTGTITEGDPGFQPALSDAGRRHPVTAELPGEAADGTSNWGRWFRAVDVVANRGTVVMTGPNGEPLLILDRVGEGRVAQMTSDQIWLWNRGYDGGGPHAELLRRLAHWLMREPSLDETALTATAGTGAITVERRFVDPAEAPASVEVTAPDGATQTVALVDSAPGVRSARVPAEAPGLWTVEDGTKRAIAVVGRLDVPEQRELRATADLVAPVAEATGGAVLWLGEDGVPELRRPRPEAAMEGRGWIGLRANGDYVVTGTRSIPMMPALIALVLALGTALVAWRREGR